MPSPRPACSPHAPCRSSLAAAGSQPAPRPPVSVPVQPAVTPAAASAAAPVPAARACTSWVVSALPPIAQSPLCTSSSTHQVTPRMFSPSIDTIASVSFCTISWRCELEKTPSITLTLISGISCAPLPSCSCAAPVRTYCHQPAWSLYARSTPEPLHPYHYGFQQADRPSVCREKGAQGSLLGQIQVQLRTRTVVRESNGDLGAAAGALQAGCV